MRGRVCHRISRRGWFLWCLLPALLTLGLAPPAHAQAQKGIALGLFSEDAGWSYRPLLEEIAAQGADHIELVVPWYLEDVGASDVHEHPRFSPPESTILRTIREAHACGLQALLFPILRLERQADPNEWRGTLKPRNRAALFASYGRALVALARLAEREHVAILSIGSELSTLDGDRAPWEALVAQVRQVFHGKLTYSGNWDHYEKVKIYDLVDYAGVCAYFSLAPRGRVATLDELRARWQELRQKLQSWAEKIHRPLLLTEVGYLSQRGAAAWPWEEGAHEPVDLDEQLRSYQAFADAWCDDAGGLAGLYFWNWYGWGGAQSRGYTPRGKPASEVIRRLFAGDGVRRPCLQSAVRPR